MLLTISPKTTSSSVLELVTVLLIFALILAATYFVTKWIGGYQKTKTSNNNLQIVEAIRLPSNKYVELIRVGKDKYIVIGVGKEEVNLLTELSDEDLMAINASPSKTNGKSFSEILNGFKSSLPNNKKDE